MSSQTNVYEIYYQPESHCVVMDWDGYATSREFREGTELMLRILVEHKAGKVLADARDMVLIGMEDQKWLHEDFIPRATDAGFRACAIISSVSYFNNVALQSISFKANREKLVINIFNTAAEARSWLESLDL